MKEESRGFVQFDSAIDRKSGAIVNIRQCYRNAPLADDLICPHCKEKMIPILGDIREHHFRHLGTHCAPNRYLHSLAIEVFLAEYERCVHESIPFFLHFIDRKPREISCCRECLYEKNGKCVKKQQEYKRKVNLTSIYSDAIREERVVVDKNGRYRIPDVRLVSSTGEAPDLWIEVFVTHEVDEEKRAQAPIVEIKIDKEDDVKIINTHVIGDKNRTVRLYNINDALFPEGSVESEKIAVNTDACTEWRPRIQTNHFSKEEGIISSMPRVSVPRYKWGIDTTQGLKINSSESANSAVGKPKKEDSSKVLFVSEIMEKFTWVDLGLPSGTLWAQFDYNSPMGFYGAMGYRKFLPNEKQVLELKEHCTVSLEVVAGKEMIAVASEKGKIFFSKHESDPGFWMAGIVDDGCAPCYRFLFSKMIRILDADSLRQLLIHFVK